MFPRTPSRKSCTIALQNNHQSAFPRTEQPKWRFPAPFFTKPAAPPCPAARSCTALATPRLRRRSGSTWAEQTSKGPAQPPSHRPCVYFYKCVLLKSRRLVYASDLHKGHCVVQLYLLFSFGNLSLYVNVRPVITLDWIALRDVHITTFCEITSQLP